VLHREILSVCCEIDTKRRNNLCRQNVQLLIDDTPEALLVPSRRLSSTVPGHTFELRVSGSVCGISPLGLEDQNFVASLLSLQL